MDPNSGRIYEEVELLRLSPEDRAKLVEIKGRREDVERISDAVKSMNRAERRAENRRRGLRSNGERKK